MKSIYVGNLDFGATEEQIRNLFAPHGKIEKITLVTDRDTGQSRGFAFVEMPENAEADAAIAALNGTQMGSRTLNINEARPKVPRGEGGGGGGGGGNKQRRDRGPRRY